MKSVFITGCTGQIGSYLAEEMLDKGYIVYGLVRSTSNNQHDRMANIEKHPNFHIIHGDLTDFSSLSKLLMDKKPDYVVNLAAQSSISISFTEPLYTWDVTCKGFLNLLEAIRLFSPKSKLFQASSSEVFGDGYKIDYDPMLFIRYYQDEDSPFSPNNVYAIAKCSAHEMARFYRKSYGLDISIGIIYPNDSPRRHESFFTRKVTKYVGGLFKKYYNPSIQKLWISHDEPKLKLGNLNCYRDFSDTRDVAVAIRLILEHDKADDFIISSGTNHKIEDFVKEAFASVNLDYKDHIEIDMDLYRDRTTKSIIGDNRKICRELGYSPKYDFSSIVMEMVSCDS